MFWLFCCTYVRMLICLYIIALTQGWPTFSVHAPKFFATQTFIWRCATQTFISFHCSEFKTTPYSGVISKKKKKRSSPVSLHLSHHIWPKYAAEREANQVRTFFFFFWRCYCSYKFFGQNIRTLTQIAWKILNLQCATSKHAMRHGWPPLL